MPPLNVFYFVVNNVIIQVSILKEENLGSKCCLRPEGVVIYVELGSKRQFQSNFTFQEQLSHSFLLFSYKLHRSLPTPNR